MENSTKKSAAYNAHDNLTFELEEPENEVFKTDPRPSKKENDTSSIAKGENGDADLVYGVEDSPPWYLAIFLGMQHYLTMVGSTMAIPYILTPMLCMADDDPTRGMFVSTIIFVSGIVTLLQSTFGVRLPIVQGGTFSFLLPTIAILTTAFPTCDQYQFSNMTDEERSEIWHVRIREIQGDIMVASIFQVLIGFTGLIGFLMSWITPLSIVPTITLVGLSLFETAASKSEGNWGIAILTIVLLTAFSQYLAEVNVPVPTYSPSVGFKISRFKIFKLFPVLLAIVLSWIVCMIFTHYDVFAPDSPARTDIRVSIIHQSPWFYVPYPFQWGMPTVTVAGVFGMLAGVLASMIESLGDYYACARLAGAPPPPKHAINRGIGIEGVGCIIAGMFGTGNGTTSYSENIGAIRVTKVGSRSVIQAGAVFMILFGVFGKFGGLFVTIPDPVLGGMFLVMFGLITAVGLSNLQFVDLNSSRNLFTLGFSLFFGISLPVWLHSHPGVIQTGSPAFDQVITVLLSTPMFVGGFCGLVLDNTIPGTREERGLVKWNNVLLAEDDKEGKRCTVYALPFKIHYFLERWRWCERIPFSSTYASRSNENSGTFRETFQRWIKNKRKNINLTKAEC